MMNIEEHITNKNDDSNDDIKFKISMKRLTLCDYSMHTQWLKKL